MKRYRIKYFSEIVPVRNIADLALVDEYEDFWCLRHILRNEAKLPGVTIDRRGSAGVPDKTELPPKQMGVLDIVAARDVSLTNTGLVLSEGRSEALVGHVINDQDVFYRNKPRLAHIEGQLGVSFEPPAHVDVPVQDGNVINHPAPTFLGYTPRDQAYSHFIYEVVARVFAYRRLKAAIPDLKFAVRKTLSGWGRDILANYGVAGDDLVLVDTVRRNIFSKFFILRGSGVNNFWVPPEIMKFLTDIRINADPWIADAPKQGRRIIISRQGSRGTIRRLINQNALWEIAENEFGYETVVAEKLDFAQKRELFSSAQFVLGEYGGGLQTHFLCRPGTQLLCLMSDMFERDLFERTADVVGLRVKSLIGPAVPKLCGNPQNSDFYIDPDHLRNALAQQTRAHT